MHYSNALQGMHYSNALHRGDLEGVGGMLQKPDAFYCILERFRQSLGYILHFSTLLMSRLTQLIVLTISSPFTEIKQHRARLMLGWVPFRLLPSPFFLFLARIFRAVSKR